MTDLHSDALVFFGATGDLAYKKIFPSLQGSFLFQTASSAATCSNLRCLNKQALRQDKLLVADSIRARF
jgi:glucose-6-phosphate 1-dehydrogenase